MFRVHGTIRPLFGMAVAAFVTACGGAPATQTEKPQANKVEAKPVEGVPQKAVEAFATGATALKQSPPDYVAAATAFEEAVKIHPAYVVAWLDLAYSYEKLGRYADSAGAYQRVLKQGVADDGITLAYGKAKLLSGDPQAAITEFESVLRNNTKSLEARTNLAAAYQVKNDFDTSLRYVKEVLAVQPKNVPAINNLGLIYLKQKKLPLALLMFTKALSYDEGEKSDLDKNKERRALVHNNLGLTHFAMGDMPRAVLEFEKAIALDATMDEARLNVASVYLDWLDYPTALAQFQAVRARFPKHYQAMVGEGNCLYGTAKYPEAAKVYEESLAVRDSNAEVLLRLGKLHEEQLNEPKKALAYYVKFRDVAKPAADHKVHATIQFLEQADTLQPKQTGGGEGGEMPAGEKPAGGEQPAAGGEGVNPAEDAAPPADGAAPAPASEGQAAPAAGATPAGDAAPAKEPAPGGAAAPAGAAAPTEGGGAG